MPETTVFRRAGCREIRLSGSMRGEWVAPQGVRPLSYSTAEWRSALCIVKPETVIAWHRKGFRLFWTWKVRRGQRGRPAVSKEIRKLIRRMSRENPLWGAPRIHGELLKLGIDVGETSVSKCASSEGWHVQWETVPPG